MEEKVKIGVIGAGMGASHVRGFLRNQDRIEVVAIADLDTARMERVVQICTEAGAPAPKCVTDYRTLLELDEIEIVLVATPNDLHAPMAVDCLRAGKHALVEKPPSNTVEGAQQIVAAVRETGNRCMIGVTNRFRTEIGRLKAMVDRGDFGDIYFAKTGWIRRHGIPAGSGAKWFIDKERAGGGPLIDLGVHVLDLTWWLMGCPKPVSVTGVTYDPFIRKLKETKANVEDMAVAFIRFEGGAAMALETSWAGHVDRERGWSQFYGTKAGIEVDLLPVGDREVLAMYTERDGDWLDITLPQYDRVDWQPVLANQLLYFADCIRADKPNMATAEEGVEIMRMLCGIYESAKTGCEVRLD